MTGLQTPHAHASADAHVCLAPVDQPFFTRGMIVVTAVMLTGLGFGLYRLVFSLEAATNLGNQYALGLWIGVDVATGVALAAGGFTVGALAYIFQRHHFHVIVRSALLTAMLGYTFVAIGLIFDLGRWYNIWHPMLPMMWQGNSVLFEVGMCVMIYLNVLYIEFAPALLERLSGNVRLPGRLSAWNDRVEALIVLADHVLQKIMPVFVIAGVVLSCLHQSSLGNLMVIAPYKLHPLYWTPLLPLLFLTSAIAVGFPMVVFESMLSCRVFGFKPKMYVLTPLAHYMPALMGVYILLKLGDMVYRGTWVFLFEGSPASIIFWLEFGLCTILPCLLLLSADIRRSPLGLFCAATLYIVGICLNRCAVFFIAFRPVYARDAYIPALPEFALTIGLIAAIVFLSRLLMTLLPVLPPGEPSSRTN